MKKVKAWLLDDWWLKIVSLVLAFFIWFVVVQANNPTDTKAFSNIKVTLINTEVFDENNQVYNIVGQTDTVNVVVRAPKSVLSSLKASDILAEADVNDMVDGEIKIVYSVYGNNSVESVKGDRDNIKIELEDKERKYIQLENKYVGQVASGFMVGGMKADQNMIEISGPKSAIDRVVSAAVTIDVTNAKNSLSANVEIVLYDSDGREINENSIAKQVDYVHVDVEILEIKTVTIYASKSGTPAEGYLYTGSIQISPSTVQIAGLPSDLTGINRLVITDSVDISGTTEDVVATVDLNKYMPDGLIFADPEFDGMATITVFVEEKEYKSFEINNSSVVFNNVPTGADVQIVSNSDKLSVTLAGLKSELEAMSSESIVVAIDFSEWMSDNNITKLTAGTYQIPADVYASGNVASPIDVILEIKVSIE